MITTIYGTTISREEQTKDLRPQLRIVFHELNSINDYMATARHFGAAQGMVARWRKMGREAAIKQCRHQGIAIAEHVESEVTKGGRVRGVVHERIAEPVFSRCCLVLRYWRPSNHRYDVFSPFAKPVIDGFVDAGLLVDDDQTRIVKFSVQFMGIDSDLKLSKEAQARRAVKRQLQKTKLLTPALYWFDFYAVA